MTPHEFTLLLLAVAVLLFTALFLGELARWLGQPPVVGEILAGIMLGPTVLGHFSPELNTLLFPLRGPSSTILIGLTNLAVVMFMLLAGMELDLGRIRRQTFNAFRIGIPGFLIPFALGFLLAWFFPAIIGRNIGRDQLPFAIFIATALSLSALSLSARTLIDLNRYRSDLGMTMMGAAIITDLLGWVCFALFLAMIGARKTTGADSLGMILITLGFVTVMLISGRWVIQRMMIWVQARLSWPSGVLGFIILLALLAAAFTEWLGVRAIFGSLLVGVAVGDCAHLREQTRTTLRQFIACIFAPIFFASIGLHIDFVARFDWQAVLLVLGTACVGKLLGCAFGAWRSGFTPREAWAMAFGLNTRGVMLIFMADRAMQYGVIRQRLFVALVITALVTSIIGGPVMARLLGGKSPVREPGYEAATR